MGGKMSGFFLWLFFYIAVCLQIISIVGMWEGGKKVRAIIMGIISLTVVVACLEMLTR